MEAVDIILNAASVINDVENAVNNCQNPGYACGSDIGDLIHILIGLGAPAEAARLDKLSQGR